MYTLLNFGKSFQIIVQKGKNKPKVLRNHPSSGPLVTHINNLQNAYLYSVQLLHKADILNTFSLRLEYENPVG